MTQEKLNTLDRITLAFQNNDLVSAKKAYDDFHNKAFEKLSEAYLVSEEQFKESYKDLYSKALDKVIECVVSLDFFELYKYMDKKTIKMQDIDWQDNIKSKEDFSFAYNGFHFSSSGVGFFKNFKGHAALLSTNNFKKAIKYLEYFNIDEQDFWLRVTINDIGIENSVNFLEFLNTRKLLNKVSCEDIFDIIGHQENAEAIQYLIDNAVINSNSYKDFLFKISTKENMTFYDIGSHYSEKVKSEKQNVIAAASNANQIIATFFNISEETANNLTESVIDELNTTLSNESKTLDQQDLDNANILLAKKVMEYKINMNHAQSRKNIL